MFSQSPSYLQQSHGLTLYGPYETDVLKQADLAIKLRNAAKIATIIGLVASTAFSIIHCDSTGMLVFTGGSAFTWFSCHKHALESEQAARSMLQELKERGPNNVENLSSIFIRIGQKFNQS